MQRFVRAAHAVNIRLDWPLPDWPDFTPSWNRSGTKRSRATSCTARRRATTRCRRRRRRGLRRRAGSCRGGLRSSSCTSTTVRPRLLLLVVILLVILPVILPVTVDDHDDNSFPPCRRQVAERRPSRDELRGWDGAQDLLPGTAPGGGSHRRPDHHPHAGEPCPLGPGPRPALCTAGL